MKKLVNIVKNPSGFDSFSNYLGEIPEENLYCILTRNRDSDILSESNFQCALARLGGESEDVVIHRFGHWACGWWEALSVKMGTEAYKEAMKIAAELEGYPLLDDEDYSQRQYDAHCSWCDKDNHEECEVNE